MGKAKGKDRDRAKKSQSRTAGTATSSSSNMASAEVAVAEAFETHKEVSVPTWMLRVKELEPWVRGLLEIRRDVRYHWLTYTRKHQLPESLAAVAHEANVWLRACDNCLGYLLARMDPEIFVDDPWFVEILRNPPPAVMAQTPAMARCQMKRAVQQCALLSRLFTAEETSGLVTEADVRAGQAFDRAAGPCGILAFLGECAVFSSTDSKSSWVVWALNEMVVLLFLVAWCGRSLHEPVLPELDIYKSHKWEEARKEDPRRIPLIEWVVRHEDFFGPATTALFRRGRAQVVAATLTSGLMPAPTEAAAATTTEEEEEEEEEGHDGSDSGVDSIAKHLAQAATVATDGGGGSSEQEAMAGLRDAVFGIPFLVQTIAEFA